MASGTIRPIEPGRADTSSTVVTAAARLSGTRVMASSPRARRTAVGGVRCGAIVGRRRAAYSITWPGTRKPAVSSSVWAPVLPRCFSASSHDGVAHGVVPWAMSPSTVIEPVEQRRPTARSCIADRSCASSSTT